MCRPVVKLSFRVHFFLQPMKKLFYLVIALAFFAAEKIYAQDVVRVTTAGGAVTCGFNFTFTNHNIAQKTIDQVSFIVVSPITDDITFLTTPTKWTANQGTPSFTNLGWHAT